MIVTREEVIAAVERASRPIASGGGTDISGEGVWQALLAVAQVPAQHETAWLIERGQPEKQVPTVWWADRKRWGLAHMDEWTEDANKAARFDTREAAEAVIGAKFTPPASRGGPSARAVEHGWITDLPRSGDYPEEGPVPSGVQGAWNDAYIGDRNPDEGEQPSDDWLAGYAHGRVEGSRSAVDAIRRRIVGVLQTADRLGELALLHPILPRLEKWAGDVAMPHVEALDLLDVIDGIVDDTHPEGDGCPLCRALDDLRVALGGSV